MWETDLSLGLVLKVMSLALFFGVFPPLKVIENMNFKEMFTSFYKFLIWPNFQDTPLIKQTIGSKLQEQVLCRETCAMYTTLRVCFWQLCE